MDQDEDGEMPNALRDNSDDRSDPSTPLDVSPATAIRDNDAQLASEGRLAEAPTSPKRLLEAFAEEENVGISQGASMNEGADGGVDAFQRWGDTGLDWWKDWEKANADNLQGDYAMEDTEAEENGKTRQGQGGIEELLQDGEQFVKTMAKQVTFVSC